MKLHLANFNHQNIFTGYGDGYVLINQIRYEKNLIVLPELLIEDWAVASVSQLEFQHLEKVLVHAPEIIILGTGDKHRFPAQALLHQLAQSRIAIEIMDTRACCRTYNILVEEGRRVAAALFI
ncbi:hypothetical protein ABF87_07685 [Nitrosomonas sp. JL21]|uniref:Mth938-like domain-containing protein n=1 Tax=Nitrosomonas sp. JL21 TaxID=153949 RepID=UPI00136BB190|nr:Mth938-like domain-containing protein [Nitrosomonas sp. JL21]MBL8498876.1 Mth938-like domain-containing protein [Nitrosomonas sp.]MCC7091628.1 Mth938-like domain-containing protein [Nitrosomonas sp.]MXS77845.1 hypothetical protein [Nitrosomonas sp. JL21]